MPQLEYEFFFKKPHIALSPVDYTKWVKDQLNELGQQGWYIGTPPQALMNGNHPTGEIQIFACREVQEMHESIPIMPTIPGLIDE